MLSKQLMQKRAGNWEARVAGKDCLLNHFQLSRTDTTHEQQRLRAQIPDHFGGGLDPDPAVPEFADWVECRGPCAVTLARCRLHLVVLWSQPIHSECEQPLVHV